MSVTLPIVEALFTTGATLYAKLTDRLTGKVLNISSGLFEVYNSAHWTNYAVALAEQTGSGYYWAARPAACAGVLVSESIYQQAGGSPTLGDTPATNLGYSAGQNVAAISGDPASAPTNLQAALATETQGAAAGVPTTSSIPTNLTNTVAGAYSGLTVRFITGAAAGMAALIANYTVVSGVLALSGGLAVAPAAGDLFIIV